MPDRLATTVDLPEAVATLHAQVAAEELVGLAKTWRTADGEMTIDYRPGDYLRIELAGDAPARTFVLEPDWTP